MKHKYKFHYVYITENLINHKKYVGDRSCNVFPNEDPYLGSGIHLKHAIKKYGKENFKKHILEILKTKEKAFNAQEKYILKYNTLSPEGYNISPKGGHQVQNSWNKEARERMSQLHKGKTLEEKYGLLKSIKIKEKISKAHKGKKLNFEIWNKGKEWDIKTKQKMSKSAKKRLENPENHWAFGKKLSEEHKEKLSKSHKGIKLSEDRKIKISNGIKGSKNGMFGTSILDKWIEKYGEEKAYKKWIEYKEKLSRNSKWNKKEVTK